MLDPTDATRLAKLLGMCGSDHAGERAAAALQADKLVRSAGLTWFDVVAPATGFESPLQHDVQQEIDAALANLEALTQWERGFIYSVRRLKKLSPKQRALLTELAAKARAYG